MIRPETRSAKTLDWVADKVLGIIVHSSKRHVWEGTIHQILDPTSEMGERGERGWRDQCPGFYALGRGDRLRLIREAISRQRAYGRIVVVHRASTRDSSLLGPGNGELVFELGGVLDELAGSLSLPVEMGDAG